MSRVAVAQTSFNGGAISRRLSARIDQSLYGIAVNEMVGFAPLVEGPAEAAPGFIEVEQALGPCRLLRFEFNTTQGHVVEASDHKWRIYTNDALIEGAPSVPLELASPYSYAQMQDLVIWADYDVLYCYHRDVQTRRFVRTGPTSFEFELHKYEYGPFESRNKDKALTVVASAMTGNVTLTASAALFAATDVGGLFQMEAGDFGDIPAWEPDLSVSVGDLRVSLERVYRAATAGRTGTWQPSHTEGLEWDGAKVGTTSGGTAAGGVQWEFLHDRIGMVRITAFTSSTVVSGEVVRNLPFSAVAGNYSYSGGYYGGSTYSPPSGAVTYNHGTWRWRHGAFSDTRGWPQAGCIWAERHCVARDNRLFLSVAGDLADHSTYNEFGEISADMAMAMDCDDPNAITALVPDEKLLALNGSGTFALGPDNAAQAFGPKNYRLRRQNHAPAGKATAVQSDGRTLYIDKSGGRIFQVEYDPGRINQPAIDLTRYARHMGRKSRRFVEIAPQRTPHNHVWAVRADGTLAVANYLPEEEVLGWADRPLAEGMAARSLTTITDPTGQFDQVWIAAEYAGAWYVLRMAEWREDGDFDDNAVMVDMAATYDGDPASHFTHAALAGKVVDIVADGRFFLGVTLDGSGGWDAPYPVSKVVIGLRYPAWITGLPLEAGGDNGPAIGKMGQIGRSWIKLLHARGLRLGVEGRMEPLRQSEPGMAWEAESGIRLIEASGDHEREPAFRIERVAPAQATVLAWGGTAEKQQK